MIRVSFLFCFAVTLLDAAPSPYYTLVETPTSRFEQRILLTPQLHQSFQVPQHQVQPFSQFQLPKQQVVYYYPQQQQVTQNLAQNPSQNLYELRQEAPWWQGVWNQIVGQGMEGMEEGSGEGGQGEGEGVETLEENKIKEMPEEPKLDEATASRSDIENDSVEIKAAEVRIGSSEKVTDKNLAQTESNPIVENASDGKSFEPSTRIPDQFSNEKSEKILGTQDPLKINSVESIEINANQNQEKMANGNSLEIQNNPLAESTLTQSKNIQESVTEDNKLKDLTESSSNLRSDPNDVAIITSSNPPLSQYSNLRLSPPIVPEVSPAFLPHVFTHNQRYYVINGPPQFYGNFGSGTPIFSLQELQPVMRIIDDNDSETKTQKIASDSMSTTEQSSAFRIRVEDESDAKKNKKYSDEPDQVSARSQLPSDDQSSTKLVKEDSVSRKEEKREESGTQARELTDESSIAQAKPSGIAIAGAGGVASSKPIANAISGPQGLSVASPSATAVAGDFNLDEDEDRKQTQTAKTRKSFNKESYLKL